MSFSGFTEEDIRKLSNSEQQSLKKGPQKLTKKVNFADNKSTKSQKPKQESPSKDLTTDENIPDDAKLDVAPSKNVNELPPVKPNITDNKISSSLEKDTNKSEEIKENETIINLKPRVPRIIDFDEFEQKQKLIEEQNRKRKELLAKALADRTKRTQEEAQRLNEIQEEFKKIDADLSNDVKILRKQIEVATLDYSECQKKYIKIEKEFLDAKMQLHQRLEKKEMLQEHLCAIIEKTEERKAAKLNELLEKLQILPQENTNSDEQISNNNN